MEHHEESPSPQPPAQPPTGYPPPYPYSQPPLPNYQPMYPPGYPPASPPQYMLPPNLPPSAYPLQAPASRNQLAGISVVLGVVGALAHMGTYVYYFESIYKANSRAVAQVIYENFAFYQLPALLIGIGGIVCAITALSRAKNQGWNGLIQAIIGLTLSILVIFGALALIIEYQLAANALQTLITS